ncbi:aminotransferase class I/II-fold pyridoxal phosphate-dependent enzyme [Parvularcula maris]|uniref:Aminotransferase n=1 Tax=Parvularcula maris TaxID=2965077 RepID=A0A9X2L9X7_9PROT|nr:aminotransferase class I/II-fold pyridoxal phosphate-dependent enzyme [Parvularcula maris]
MFRFPALEGLPPYLFADLAARKAVMVAEGRDVLDLGLGNPDLPPPAHALETLRAASAEEASHGYAFTDGSPELRQAQADYYQRRFGVTLDPRTQVLQTIGSKEGFATLARTICSPGDRALVPNPSYPIHRYGFLMAGGTITDIPDTPDKAQLRAVDEAAAKSPAPIAWVLNYPGNPTTRIASLDFYREAVALAKKRGLLIISDLAYGELYYGDPPPSIFEVPGAIDTAVEITSVSKTFSMAGWRIGFLCGQAEVVAAVAKVKSYLDYGTFEPLKRAATEALRRFDESCPPLRETYRKRRDALAEGFAEAGVSIEPTPATMFQWLPIPKGEEGGSLGFADRALQTEGIVVSPGIGFGSGGDGHVRVALVKDEPVMREVGLRLARLYAGH